MQPGAEEILGLSRSLDARFINTHNASLGVSLMTPLWPSPLDAAGGLPLSGLLRGVPPPRIEGLEVAAAAAAENLTRASRAPRPSVSTSPSWFWIFHEVRSARSGVELEPTQTAGLPSHSWVHLICGLLCHSPYQTGLTLRPLLLPRRCRLVSLTCERCESTVQDCGVAGLPLQRIDE